MPLDKPIKAAERTARRIVQDIADGGFRPGDVLASEAEMLGNYQISRGTLREALRLLETLGLVAMKSGPSGGPVVGVADPFYLGRASTLFFRLAGATYDDIADALLAIEPLIAKLAAERHDPQAASRLMASLASESCELTSTLSESHRNAAETLTDFHGSMGQLCGNPVLGLMASALGSIFLKHIVQVGDATPILRQSHEDHLHIAESIINGDGDQAWSRARSHMQRLIDFHRGQVPGIFAQPVQWR
jgi:DNA-binding FadR family transcriptional regulator